MLGIRNRKVFRETLEEVGMDSLDVSCRADDGMWLDVNPVQQLQTDLLSFAEEVSAFAKALSVPKHVKLKSDKGSRGPKRIPKSVFGPSDESCKEQKSLQARYLLVETKNQSGEVQCEKMVWTATRAARCHLV